LIECVCIKLVKRFLTKIEYKNAQRIANNVQGIMKLTLTMFIPLL
jgi:hypothetical protein